MISEQRTALVQTQLAKFRIDALLVTDVTNLQYLTGLADLEGCLVITQTSVALITDRRFETVAQTVLPATVDVILTRDYWQAVVNFTQSAHIDVLGFEDSMPYAVWSWLDEMLLADFVGLTGVVEAVRRFKAPAEQAALRKSCAVAVAGYAALMAHVHVGMTERKVANWLDAWMRDHGATHASFETIVASGVRAAEPHGAATTKPLALGGLVTVDFGYYVDEYTSDMTRTFALGTPAPELVTIYKAVQTANEAVINAVKPGVTGPMLDQTGRELIENAGYGAAFNHGMGHGIGLSIHEMPVSYSAMSDYVAQTNEILTVEPGIYVPGLGGVRIEDDVLVTATGVEILTPAPKTLQIL
ncbi:M24 family metallopeptidase [Furfurilactobacillus entadae]|uniref:M24 family metallopeptidase n=1 Tax=Furfurilactobacillus entadae TaxID=2922307 RepID=UPI0035EBB8C8